MEQGEAIKLFYQFLVENNALFNYLKYTSFEKLKNTSSNDFIFFMTRWSTTDEGYDYWSALCNKWWEKLKQNNLYERD